MRIYHNVYNSAKESVKIRVIRIIRVSIMRNTNQ